ncbi:TPA: hypothetical protein DEO28_04885 [Candidatus Dependentiae bacterium]|nr:MAG: Lipopolysaccharide heptosyltransferase I [candidate division TM6 bacterium GW2011_GWE2_31_21]KKP53887.1 MAG: Lipopolysaccharide heptosyltransferase I [candidate division TM6 bacterium GW2011_GWF2_33_332]HBS47667.1 hypothetical protein [Candidatus Dependentiae bacterium]HBZ73816.1 hypothetical protein [Candidatus Dependentiae bacterium]
MKILILRVSAIGDVVHTLSSIFLLKRLYPNCEISWVVQEKAAELILDQPFLDEVFVLKDKFLKFENLKHTLGVIKKLRQTKWDVIIDFQGILKTSILSAFLKGPKIGFAVGHARDRFTTFFTKYQVTPNYFNIIQKNLALADSAVLRYLALLKDELSQEFYNCSPAFEQLKKDFYLDFSNQTKSKVETWITENNLTKFVIIAPNTTWPSKHWPKENWQELLQRLVDAKIDTVLFGSFFGQPGINLASFCVEKKLRIFIPPKMDLNDYAYLISKSLLLVAPDTGFLHMADFLQVKTIAIFGPTSAKMHGPFILTENIENAIQVPCCHFRQKTHGKNNEENCMAALKAETVFEKILKLLN